MYMINDPEMVREMLLNKADIYEQSPMMTKKAGPLLGSGVGMVSGERHHRQRRLMQPAFHRSRVALYADTMSRLAVEKATAWHDGQEIAMDEEMAELTLATIVRTLFSFDLPEHVVTDVHQAFPVVLEGITWRSVAPATLSIPPTANNRRFKLALRRLHKAIDFAIESYRVSGLDHEDLLSILLLARDEETGTTLSDQKVHDEVMTMMVAGTGTTGAALAWVFHELGRHPEIERQLHEELDTVLDRRPATFEDVAKLEYTKRVVTETIRFYARGSSCDLLPPR